MAHVATPAVSKPAEAASKHAEPVSKPAEAASKPVESASTAAVAGVALTTSDPARAATVGEALSVPERTREELASAPPATGSASARGSIVEADTDDAPSGEGSGATNDMGCLCLELQFEPASAGEKTSGTVHVNVKEARGLPATNASGTCDPYIKVSVDDTEVFHA